MGVSLSLALIVRDEALHVAECLACFADLEPEICVVDTGSTDDTLRIAQSHGARVRNILWDNDFSAARNVSLDMCSRDWVFVVDADERIAPEDLDDFRRLLDGPRTRAYRFLTRNYTSNPNVSGFQPSFEGDRHSRTFPGWFPSAKVRLFPNDPRVRFEGLVHELVNSSLERAGYPIDATDVPVHHYPLLRSAEATSRKQLLYIELGHKKVRKSPWDPKAHIELGHQYADLADYPAAAAAYRAALELGPTHAETLKDLGSVLHLMGRHSEAQTALELAVRLEPGMEEGWRNLGVVHGARNEWRRAIRCFQQALRLNAKWADGHRFLSIALEKANRLEESATEAQAALELLPGSIEAAENFINIVRRLGRVAQGRDLLGTLLLIRPDARGWRYGRDRLEADDLPGASAPR